jgi:hypothetical protein
MPEQKYQFAPAERGFHSIILLPGSTGYIRKVDLYNDTDFLRGGKSKGLENLIEITRVRFLGGHKPIHSFLEFFDDSSLDYLTQTYDLPIDELNMIRQLEQDLRHSNENYRQY